MSDEKTQSAPERTHLFHFANHKGEILFGEVNHTGIGVQGCLKLGLHMARYFLPGAKITKEPRDVIIKGRHKLLYDFGHPYFFIAVFERPKYGKVYA